MTKYVLVCDSCGGENDVETLCLRLGTYSSRLDPAGSSEREEDKYEIDLCNSCHKKLFKHVWDNTTFPMRAQAVQFLEHKRRLVSCEKNKP